MKLHKKLEFKGKLTLLSGLHIGDSKESVEIGGVDSPVVRRKDNNQPYIPGSSLKGKIRSLLEISFGENSDSRFQDYKSEKGKTIQRLFGSIAKDGNPSRILFRDCYLTEDSVKKLDESEYTDMPFSEIKFENVIDRKTGTTKGGGLRQIERVPAGSEFSFSFVLNIVSPDGNAETAKKEEAAFKELLKRGFTLLEKDYLGGSGSRGYGQVKLALNWENPEILNLD